MRAFDGTRESSDSNEASATPIDNLAAAAPTGLTAADRPNDDGGANDLSWTPSTSGGVTEQRLYRGNTSGSANSLFQTFTDNTTNSFTDTGLTNGVPQFYVVRAFDGTSESSDSNEASATPTDNLTPAAPTGLTAVDSPNDDGGAIDLSWTPSTSGDVTGQRLYRGNSSGTADGTNESGDSNEASATPTDNLAPAAPTGLSAVDRQNDEGDSVDLSWTPSTSGDVTAQRLYRGNTAGNADTLFQTFADNATNSFTDAGIANGVAQFYVVRASDGTNESVDSNEASATPADNLAPAAPTGLDATAGDQTVLIDWNDNSELDLDGYNVYYSTTEGGPYVEANTVLLTSSAHLHTGLTNGVIYYYVATAVDDSGNESSFSNEDAAKAGLIPSGVPGLGQWGLIALTGALALAVFWRLRRPLSRRA